MSKADEGRRAEGQTTVTSVEGLSCVGTVYIDKDGNVRIDMSKSPCPAELIDAIEGSVMAGREIVFDVGRKKTKT